MALNDTQAEVFGEIVSYGENQGFTDQQIKLATDIAFIESSLGIKLANPQSSASGLYQYLDATWNDRHAVLGEKNNQTNQITAFYSDLNYFTSRYNDLTQEVKGDVSLEEYVYIKHHDGSNYEEIQTAPGRAIYNKAIDEDHNQSLKMVTLCVNKDTYIFDGAAAASTNDSRIVKWITEMDSAGQVQAESINNVLITEARKVVNADPTESFYIQE